MNDSIKLVRFMSEEAYLAIKDGGLYTSHDEDHETVSRFLMANNLPDPEPFVCATACTNGFSSTDSVNGFGEVIGYLDIESVLLDIVLVSTEDIQNAASNNHPKRVCAFKGDEKNRRAVILRAIEECPRGRYPEVRIGRALRFSDFEGFDTTGSYVITLLEGEN